MSVFRYDKMKYPFLINNGNYVTECKRNNDLLLRIISPVRALFSISLRKIQFLPFNDAPLQSVGICREKNTSRVRIAKTANSVYLFMHVAVLPVHVICFPHDSCRSHRCPSRAKRLFSADLKGLSLQSPVVQECFPSQRDSLSATCRWPELHFAPKKERNLRIE